MNCIDMHTTRNIYTLHAHIHMSTLTADEHLTHFDLIPSLVVDEQSLDIQLQQLCLYLASHHLALVYNEDQRCTLDDVEGCSAQSWHSASPCKEEHCSRKSPNSQAHQHCTK